MSVDWVTVVAQVVNFLVLVYLLKRFLYRPVIDAMQRREQRIAERLEEASTREDAAAEEEAAYRASKQELEQRREQLESEARDAAERRRKELLESARAEVESARGQWFDALEREKSGFLRQLRRLAADEITAATRRLLGDLADASLEERMAARFVERLRGVGDEARAQLAGADEIVVASAFELGGEARAAVTDAVREVTGSDTEPRIERDEDIVCGIELRLDGYKLAWTAERYLDAVERRVAEQLEVAG